MYTSPPARTDGIANSCCGIFFGIVLVCIATPVLVFNEGNAIKVARSLDEGLAQCQSISSPFLEKKTLDNKLIHLTGNIRQSPKSEKSPVVIDEEFAVAANGVFLKRSVEMLQWKETRHETVHRQQDGREYTEVSYDYDKTWDTQPINSNHFHDAGHENPDESSWPFTSKVIKAEKAYLGMYSLSSTLLGQITSRERVMLDSKSRATMRKHLMPPEQLQNSQVTQSNTVVVRDRKLQVVGDFFKSSKSLHKADVGDIRISFSAVPAKTVSVIAKKYGNALVPFLTSGGETIEMLEEGIVDANLMFQHAHESNNAQMWFIRVFGGLLMFLGFWVCLQPISAIAQFFEFIPLFGSLFSGMVSLGVFLAALSISLSVSLFVISVSWIYYRPYVAFCLIAMAAVPIFGLLKQPTSRKSSKKY